MGAMQQLHRGGAVSVSIARILVAAVAALAPVAAAAAPLPRVQSLADALAQDGAEYARRHAVPVDEAIRRLAAQEQSVAATERVRSAYAARLAGISIEHNPEYRIVVLLTGSDPVPNETIVAGGVSVPVHYRTGARVTREQAVTAMRVHQASLREILPRGLGIGFDQRTGELVQMVRGADADRHGADALKTKLEALTGVPFRLRVIDREGSNDSVHGGARVAGIEPMSGRRQACTTGFVVTDGTRSGILTAAHCPDMLDYLSADGTRLPLAFVGKWGARYQDVQVLATEAAQRPLFHPDSGKRLLRPVNSWRNRASTRAGDTVCRRGETTGYSCAEVELTDYAPGGALCAGPCDPAWTTVAGPICKAGDSGGPIFLGTTAFGIVKGSNYSRDRSTCLFSFYMSTDFLPEGWRLVYE